MITKEIITDLVNDLVEGSETYLVDVSIQPGNKIFVYIDGDKPLTVEDCRSLNRRIEEKFDRDTEDYDLTVSSYGIDRPLRLIRQYRKNTGRELEVDLNDGSKTGGIIVSVSDEEIELDHPVMKKKEIKKPNSFIKIGDIKTAKIKIKFGK